MGKSQNPTSNLMSPLQRDQKVIEYMLENNDFNLYNNRRPISKVDKLSRTLSHSFRNAAQGNFSPECRVVNQINKQSMHEDDVNEKHFFSP